MPLPQNIARIFEQKNKCLAENDFAGWSNLVFLLKKSIIQGKSKLSKADLEEIKKTIASHREKLNEKHRFLKKYRELIFR